MGSLLQDGLTAPLRYKLMGLLVALVLGFCLTMAAFLLRVVTDMGFVTASLFGILMGVIGLIIAGALARVNRVE